MLSTATPLVYGFLDFVVNQNEACMHTDHRQASLSSAKFLIS